MGGPVGKQVFNRWHAWSLSVVALRCFFNELFFERDIELAHAPGRPRRNAVDEGDEVVELQRRAQRRLAGAFGQEKVAAAGARHRILGISTTNLETVDGRRGPGCAAAHSASVRVSSQASAAPDSSGRKRWRTVA